MSRRSTQGRWLAAIAIVLVLHLAAGLALLSVRPTLPFAPEPRIFEVALLALPPGRGPRPAGHRRRPPPPRARRQC